MHSHGDVGSDNFFRNRTHALLILILHVRMIASSESAVVGKNRIFVNAFAHVILPEREPFPPAKPRRRLLRQHLTPVFYPQHVMPPGGIRSRRHLIQADALQVFQGVIKTANPFIPPLDDSVELL